MISPEVLRRYPLFADMDSSALRELAMMTEEVNYSKGEVIHAPSLETHHVFVLETGCIERYLIMEDPETPIENKEFYLDDINPGELFGFSAILGKRIYTNTARASRPGKMLRIDADKLLNLLENNPVVGYKLVKSILGHLMERLEHDRTLLAAARPEK